MNLTIVIEDELLRAARIKALQQGTSVNEICREAIARFAGATDDHAERMKQLRALADKITKAARAAGPASPPWPSREAMYDEMLAERMPTLYNKPRLR